MKITTPPLNPRRHPLSAIVALMVALISAPSVFALLIADFNLPAQDSNGWTILSPEQDSRLIYVDSVLGNDSTGQIYYPGDNAIGSDPRNPAGTVMAFRTLAAAYGQTRNREPDWMLLRAGRVWENQALAVRRGRSATERAVVCAYGQGDRPDLRTGAAKGISTWQFTDLIVRGLKFWAHTRDSDGPYFQSYDGTAGFEVMTGLIGDDKPVRDALLEDCVFRSYKINLVHGTLQNPPRVPVERFVMRRNIISGHYSADGHSQGLQFRAEDQPAGVPAAVLLEGNTFDHNGWRIPSQDGGHGLAQAHGQATQKSHNLYFTTPRMVLMTGNIFARASSMGNKFTAERGTRSSGSIYVINNLYVEGELGVSAGGNDPASAPLKFYDMHINDNVMTNLGRTRPTNRDLAWYIGIKIGMAERLRETFCSIKTRPA